MAKTGKNKKPIKTKLRKDDTVIVLCGKDKGKTGRILHIDRMSGRAIVEKINMVKKTQRPSQSQPKGGIMEIEAPIRISNLMLLDSKSSDRSRVGFRFEDGRKIRFAKKSGKTI